MKGEVNVTVQTVDHFSYLKQLIRILNIALCVYFLEFLWAFLLCFRPYLSEYNIGIKSRAVFCMLNLFKLLQHITANKLLIINLACI